MAIATPPPPSASTSAPRPEIPSLPPPYRPRPRGLMGGLFLIALGVLFLAQQLAAPNWSWDVLWPVVLIVIGVAVGASPLVYGQPLHYARSFWAVALIAVGGLFLSGNLGYLNGWQFSRLGDLWPLILVLVGIEILITRSLPRPTAAVAGAAVALLAIAAALLYVGLGPAIPYGSTSSSASAPIGSLQQATLELSVSGTTVTINRDATPGQLYSASFRYGNAETPVADVNRSSGVIRIEVPNRWLVFGPRQSRSIDLNLSDQIPWSITINGGASQQTLDLSAVKLTRLSITGGAQQVTIILPAAAGEVPIEVNGGATSVTIHRPAGSEAGVVVSGGANGLTADGQHQPNLAGDLNWQSTGYTSAANRYSIRVSGGANHVTVDTR